MADGVQVKFGANITDLVEGINSAVGELRSFAEAVGAMYVADKTAKFIAQFGDMGEKIERATAVFGASTKDVQELQLANELAGGSGREFRRVGGPSATRACSARRSRLRSRLWR